MCITLIEALQQVPDFRAKRGQRYPLWVILLLVVLGTLNGATSYQALAEFAQRHYQALMAHLQLSCKRLPSDSTVRRALMGVDFTPLAQAFMAWATPDLDQDASRWFAIDGKGLNGSITAPCETHQQFVNLVSVFSHSQGIVVALKQYRSNQGSEIEVVERLIAALDLQAVTDTLDVAHTQKKTVKTMIEQGNDDVITVKANQKSLLQRLSAISRDCTPVSVYHHVEQGHQRFTQRTVEVFDCLAGIAVAWLGLQRFVRVHRQGLRDGKPYSQWSYYITSFATTAQQFAEGIRGHWGIENRLHGVKDVVFGEDACPLKLAQAPENWGLIRTGAVNLFRLHGEVSMTKAQRRVAHDIHALFLLIQ